MEDLRDSVQVQRGRVRGNTPEGGDFFFPHKSHACIFLFSFFEGGPFIHWYICCREDRFTGGTPFSREGEEPCVKIDLFFLN